MFSLNKSLTQSLLILTISLNDTHKLENMSVFCHYHFVIKIYSLVTFLHYIVAFYNTNLQFSGFLFHKVVTFYNINLQFCDFFLTRFRLFITRLYSSVTFLSLGCNFLLKKLNFRDFFSLSCEILYQIFTVLGLFNPR